MDLDLDVKGITKVDPAYILKDCTGKLLVFRFMRSCGFLGKNSIFWECFKSQKKDFT